MALYKITAEGSQQMTGEEETAQRLLWANSYPSGQRAGLLKQIADLEAQQTPRRLREAVAGTDGGWLTALEDQIAALRAYL